MPSIIPLDSLLGSTFIGIMASTVVYGITCLQAYLYYTEHSARDGPPMKIFVAVLCVLDTFHVALLGHLYYYYTVTNFGDYGRLVVATWSLATQIGVGGTLTLFVHIFYVRRIYLLSERRRVVPIIITVLALAKYANNLGYAVRSDGAFFAKNTENTAWATSGLSLDIAVDTFITIAISYHLLRRKTTFGKTNHMVNMLITYILNTCLLTTICTIACLAFIVAKPNTLLYAPFYFMLVRLYSCSLLSTLNSRDNLREHTGLFSNRSHTTSGRTNTISGLSTSLGTAAAVELETVNSGPKADFRPYASALKDSSFEAKFIEDDSAV